MFWRSLKNIALEQKTSLRKLIEDIDAKNPENLSSAIRIFVFSYYKNKFKF